jgi:hypothetical protein
MAHADKMTDAEDLFRRAKALMTDNKFREACPLLEESDRLDPQMGTLLNLAICHENIGKIASAWGEFRAVEQQARAANREERVKLAHERASKLEPRLARVKILVPSDVRVPGLVVKVDGEAKAEALWPGIAVDPGTRAIDVSAPGKKPATLKVRVDDEGIVVPVTLPKLEDAPVAPPTTANTGDDRVREERYAENRSRKTKGLVIGGMGLATAAIGGVFGVLAVTADSGAHHACPLPCIEGSPAAKSADEKTDRAFLFANLSNVVIPLGAIVTAVGAYFFLTAGPTEKEGAFVSPRHVGLRW